MKEWKNLIILFLLFPVLLGFAGCTFKSEPESTLIELDPSSFRGFNLISKILVGDWVTGDTEEWAFEFMEEEGFNFARIPMEVQELYQDENYTLWSDDALLEIDRIIALGQKYHIHILLDLHTLPGIRPGEIPASDSNFNTDERLAIWKDIFQVLSHRYRDIPNTDLSYNLINEPYNLDTEEYMDAIRQLHAIIRNEDATKLLFIDPNHWTCQPLYDLVSFEDPYLVASPHFYQPFLVTHYLAQWVDGADNYPVPKYPSVDFSGFLYGDYHFELQEPLKINGLFSKGTVLKVRINEISSFVDLTIITDKESLYQETFQTNDDPTLWKEINFSEEWQIYQNTYDQDIEMTLTQEAKEISIALSKGDWLTISSITIDNPLWSNPFSIEARSLNWGTSTDTLSIDSQGTLIYEQSNQVVNKDYLFENYFKDWTVFKRSTGIPVVACEFGVYNKTDHSTTLKVLEDNLSLFKENNFGFALWNFTGDFGIFDSNRDDVDYEDYEGHELDRQMLELLKKY